MNPSDSNRRFFWLTIFLMVVVAILPGVVVSSKLARIGEKAGAVSKQRERTGCGQIGRPRWNPLTGYGTLRRDVASHQGRRRPCADYNAHVPITLGFACLLNISEQRSGRWFQTGFLSVQTYPDGFPVCPDVSRRASCLSRHVQTVFLSVQMCPGSFPVCPDMSRRVS